MELKNTFRDVHMLGLGGTWILSVCIATDSMGVDKVRVAKGKWNGEGRPPAKNEVDFDAGPMEKLPFTQANKFNLKRRAEWDWLAKMVPAGLEQLEA